jgi:hypothetical protein
MKFKAGIGVLIALLVVSVSAARGQTPVTTMALGPNQIGLVKTTQGITTRIAFPDPVKEIICGDLYDASSGKGAFVVQRSDNDVFLKPVVSKGVSNLFVKTGEKGEHVYCFDLVVVTLEQAYRMVNVAEAPSNPPQVKADQAVDAGKGQAGAQQQADEILRKARAQADKITEQANGRATEVYSTALQRTAELDRQAARRAQQEVESRFLRAMIQGVREVKTNDSRIVNKRVNIELDPRVLTFDEKSYLRYFIKNNGDKEFTFGAISLEKSSGKKTDVVPVEVKQGRAENRLKPGETIIGIIVFDPKLVEAEDKLTLYLRGQDNAEIARLSIQ